MSSGATSCTSSDSKPAPKVYGCARAARNSKYAWQHSSSSGHEPAQAFTPQVVLVVPCTMQGGWVAVAASEVEVEVEVEVWHALKMQGAQLPGGHGAPGQCAGCHSVHMVPRWTHAPALPPKSPVRLPLQQFPINIMPELPGERMCSCTNTCAHPALVQYYGCLCCGRASVHLLWTHSSPGSQLARSTCHSTAGWHVDTAAASPRAPQCSRRPAIFAAQCVTALVVTYSGAVANA